MRELFLKNPFYALYFFLLFSYSSIVFLWQVRFFHQSIFDIPWLVALDSVFVLLISIAVSLFFTGMLYQARSSENLMRVYRGNNAIGIAGFLTGVIALLCPVCNIGLFLIFGVGLNLAFFAPYIWYAKIFAVLLLSYGVWDMDKKLQQGFSCQL